MESRAKEMGAVDTVVETGWGALKWDEGYKERAKSQRVR